MNETFTRLIAALFFSFLTSFSFAGDPVLSGTVASGGKKLDGVTVSAKRDGSTITTSVYTDKAGRYVFPPLPAGSYRVWAQALGFETATQSVDVSANAQKDFALEAIADAEKRYHQLPSEMVVAGLPEATPHDARMKKIFMNNCTGCHPASYTLQFKFDEDGWTKIIDLMKVVPVTGQYLGPQAKANQLLERHQKELAAYLARARGPGESSIRVKARPRPSGEAARAVWRLYDLPLNPGVGIGTQTDRNPNDAHDWTRATTSKLGQLPHDGAMGADGNVYFTVNNANTFVTVGRIDAKTGEVKWIKAEGKDGRAANAHGLVRGPDGSLWFDVDTGRRGIGKLEPGAETIKVYQTPSDMAPVGGAVTIDVDGKGFVWASTPAGVVRFDPRTEQFTEFKSAIGPKNPRGLGATYGAAGDRDGNGWWAQMAMDTVYKADVANGGKVIPIKIPDAKAFPMTAEEHKFYEGMSDLGFNAPLPWSPGPRRMGTDKRGDVLWVGNSWGSSFARIDTRTNQVSVVPLPDKTMQAYHVVVDSRHRAWGNLWTSDRLVRYDPATKAWAVFDLPVRGSEIRHIALDERDGKLSIIVPVYRPNQMGVLTFRTEKEIADTLKN